MGGFLGGVMRVLAIFAIALLMPALALADTSPCRAPASLDNAEAARAIGQSVEAQLGDAPVDLTFIDRARARIAALTARYDLPRDQIIAHYVFHTCKALNERGMEAFALKQTLARVSDGLAEPAPGTAAQTRTAEADGGSETTATAEVAEAPPASAAAPAQPSAQIDNRATSPNGFAIRQMQAPNTATRLNQQGVAKQARRNAYRIDSQGISQRGSGSSAKLAPRGTISQSGAGGGGGVVIGSGQSQGNAANARIDRAPATTQRMARAAPQPAPAQQPVASAPETAPADIAEPTPAPAAAPAVVAAAPPAAQPNEAACPERGVLGPECFDVDEALERLRDRPVEYNHPEQMIKGQATEITLVLRTDFTEEGLPEQTSEAFERLQGEVKQQRAKISNIMSARLRGRDFEVDPGGIQERTITWRRPVEWSWYVTPKTGGEAKRLELELYAHIVNPQGETQPPVLIKTLDATIDVDVRTLDWLIEQARTFEPIYAVVAAIIGFFTALITLWFRRRPAHPGEAPPSGITTAPTPPQRRVSDMSASEAAAEAARKGQDESGSDGRG